ncbi:histidine phosphatase family protein [Ilumatobacteraceae bacterium]|nr:histidine phosphatase family protein [Ilumatobacteraceae bacterium]
MIVLVRHGRTALNASGRLQGRVDEPLDEIGILQVRRVGEHLAQTMSNATIITSPLLRARQTAEGLAEAIGGPSLTVDDRWVELDYGVLDTMPVSEVPAATWQSWRTDPDFRPDGGETFAELDTRVHSACEDLAIEFVEANVIVVSHVSPIKSAVTWSLGADHAVAHRSRLDQASICRIDIGRHGPILVGFNEVVPIGLGGG